MSNILPDLRSTAYKRSSKVDIKGICQKFEDLSNVMDSNTKASENSATPIPPVRRKKSYEINCSNHNRARSNDLTSQNTVSNNPPSNVCVQNSVKERTKLFESPNMNENKAFIFPCKATKDILQSSILPSERCNNNESLETKRFGVSNFNSSYVNTPPAKPPRSFAHPEIDATSPKNFLASSKKCSADDIKISEEAVNVSLGFKENNTSLNLESTSSTSILENPRYTNTPEPITNRTPKSSLLASKSQKISDKKQAFFNCFKTISNTANNLCEKVKQKHLIFIDLTPTTVSPPKHYGTLKKSLSEEHIYAEPIAVSKCNSNKLESQTTEPLHYMCTPLISPDVPIRHKSNEENLTARQSVRNMIYGSFASLRTTPKDTSENTSTTTVLESSESDVSTKAIEARIIYVKSVRKQISTSSICLAPKLYEVLYIINVQDDQPVATFSFPLKVPDKYKFPLLPHICFSHNNLWKLTSVYQSETFNFTLIDKDEAVFGYCLRIQGWPETSLDNESLCVKLPVAICILSSFHAPVFYKKLLIEVEKHLSLPRNKCFKYIRSLQKLGVPNAGASLSIPDFTENETDRTVISRPLDSHFVGLEMTRALQLLDVDILVKCVASLFLERRILFFSSRTCNLYHCCKAITSLLYPFEWPHLIVPVLPACLTVDCYTEQPYVLGIVNKNCDSILELLAEHELLIIDIDKGVIIKSCNDEDTILPKKVQKAVTSALNLAKNMTDPTEMLRDIMISEAFVHMSVEMIGHYENHFIDVNGNMTFQKESFLKNSFSYNIQSFLQWFSETQMFDCFIEESLWRIKYRDICQTSMRTFFEKRVDEYKWELSHGGEKLSRIIGKTVRNFGEILKGLKKNP